MSRIASTKSSRLIVRDGVVKVRELAESIGLDRSVVLKDLKKRGIATEKRRDVDARGAYISVLTRADAEGYLSSRRSETVGGGGEITYIDR